MDGEKYANIFYNGIITKFKKDEDFDELLKNYKLFKKNYSVNSRWSYYESFCDFLVSINMPEEAFEEWVLLQKEERSYTKTFTYRNSAVKKLIYFEGLLEKSLVSGHHVHKIAKKGHQLTSFGNRNINEVFKTLDIFIENTFNMSFFEQFFSNYNYANINSLKTLNYKNYKKFFTHNNEAKNQWKWLIGIDKYNEENRPARMNTNPFILKDESVSFQFLVEAIRSESSRILREAENTYRLSIGAKKIGQSWIGETELYYKLKKSFPQTNVIQHGRPSWLGRQHLDVWMPEYNIAIEYQGKQHDMPIDFFGGLDAYEKGVKRDLLKKIKCKKHNVLLIEVRKGYDLNDIIKEIKMSI